MFRSLMFKTNPLTEEFDLYRRRNALTMQAKSFSIKSKSKNQAKHSPQKKYHISQVKKLNLKSIRYDQLKSVDETLASVTDRNTCINFQEKAQKIKFKINNPIKNDNYFQKEQNPSGKEEKPQTEVRDLGAQNNILNPEISKPPILRDQRVPSRHRSKNFHKRQTNNIETGRSGQVPNVIKGPESKNSIRLDEEIKKQLKSTLYQSIDLGNLFQKIQTNMSRQDKLTSSHAPNKIEPFMPGFMNSIDKTTQIKRIEFNRHNLKEQMTENKLKMNRYNLQNLMQKNNKKTNESLPQKKTLKNSQFQSNIARSQLVQKEKGNSSYIIDGMNQTRQQSWMPTRRKRSIAIVMDDNGIIRQESSGMGESEVDSVRMSRKISNLRQMMKGEQVEVN